MGIFADMICRIFRVAHEEIDVLLEVPEQLTTWAHRQSQYCDLDVAWDGLHFLLSSMQESENEWLSFLLDERRCLQVYESAGGESGTYYTPQHTRLISNALSAISDEAVRQHFHPQDFDEHHIYATNHWADVEKREENIAYILGHVHAMKTFIASAVADEKGLLVYIYLQYVDRKMQE